MIFLSRRNPCISMKFILIGRFQLTCLSTNLFNFKHLWVFKQRNLCLFLLVWNARLINNNNWKHPMNNIRMNAESASMTLILGWTERDTYDSFTNKLLTPQLIYLLGKSSIEMYDLLNYSEKKNNNKKLTLSESVCLNGMANFQCLIANLAAFDSKLVRLFPQDMPWWKQW